MSYFTQDACSKDHGSLFSLPLELASHPQCFHSSTCPKGSVLLNQYSLHFLFLVWPTSAAQLVNCIFKEASKFLEGQSLILSNNFLSGCIRANGQVKYWELDHQSGRDTGHHGVCTGESAERGRQLWGVEGRGSEAQRCDWEGLRQHSQKQPSLQVCPQPSIHIGSKG